MIVRLVLSLLVGAIGLIVGFILTFAVALARFEHTAPHDGDGGLAAFVYSLYAAPLFGLAAFAFYFIVSRKRFAS